MATTIPTTRYERDTLRDLAAEMTAAIQRFQNAARHQGYSDLADDALRINLAAHILFDKNWERTRSDAR